MTSVKPPVLIAFTVCFFILFIVYNSLDTSYTTHSFRTSRKHYGDDTGSHEDSYYYDRQQYEDSSSSRHRQEYQDARLENVRNATLGFGKVFVVSMKERSDRRDSLALAAAGTGFDVTFVDGVRRQEVPDKALPPLHGTSHNDGTVGAWRTHLNILREIVQTRLGSALIFEEDADWDVRIKDTLEQVAQSTRALIQPLDVEHGHSNYTSNGTLVEVPVYADPSYPFGEFDIQPEPMIFGDLPKTKEPTTSPYGDGWDMIHLGHCGLVSPKYPDPHLDENLRRWVPKGHVMINDDPTVPEPHHITHVDEVHYPSFRWYEEGRNHTRAVHHSMKFICTHGFAISQEGARKLLHYTGVRALDAPFDAMVEHYCQDQDTRMHRGACLGVQPAMFAQYRPPGDISKDFEIESPWFADHHGEEREKGFDYNLRYSAMINMKKLVSGETDFEDQYPDTNVSKSANSASKYLDGPMSYNDR